MSANRVADLPADLVDAAQRVWFAGLGAMALAQEQGGKLVDGTSNLFSALVEKGQEMEREGQSPVARVKGATGAAEDAWARVQRLFDAQVTATLNRLGVPTKDEVAELTRRVEQLTASIEALRAQG